MRAGWREGIWTVQREGDYMFRVCAIARGERVLLFREPRRGGGGTTAGMAGTDRRFAMGSVRRWLPTRRRELSMKAYLVPLPLGLLFLFDLDSPRCLTWPAGTLIRYVAEAWMASCLGASRNGEPRLAVETTGRLRFLLPTQTYSTQPWLLNGN